MTLRCYRFTCNLNDTFESVKENVRAFEDYFPVNVSIVARGSNGVRYPSNTITVHKYDERALKSVVYYPLANAMEDWGLDAAANGEWRLLWNQNRGGRLENCGEEETGETLYLLQEGYQVQIYPSSHILFQM